MTWTQSRYEKETLVGFVMWWNMPCGGRVWGSNWKEFQKWQTNVAERLGYTGHSLVTASFHAIPNQFRRSPWVEILVIKSQQHDMNVSRWWVQVKWQSESGHWWFQSWRCIATQRLLQPPHKVQPLHLFIIQYFSKGDRRWSVGECWHVFVLHTSSGFPYQFFHNKTRFSDMMPFKSWAGCEIYLHVEFKQDW